MNKAPADRYLEVKDAAHYLSVSEKTIRRWIAAQQLTAYRNTRGRMIRIKKSDLDQILTPTNAVRRAG
ncbi:helix-turn-helix domain-containing protein [Corynebacterium sp. HMSC28B08]|uniref:helix-turn-helix domain-containing protein n=1 Tax=Corynebacterium TaxID=1716 RepID=UPI0008A28BF3|nr:helix-turn-helix domain-containing protein [Corynebacterium sp. HMSC28B08]OFT89246.1 hypothetical protein HMPREF3098_05810 [Corynebacterium sp. HMSC28B08]